jgi:superoxide oxidase
MRLIGENNGLAKQFEDVHGLIGNVGYALIRIHALAALIHHYVQRDNTLRRMLPSTQGR